MYVVIGGTGSTGGRLAGVLADRHDVVAIETDEHRCEQLYAELGILVINGSATDIRVLEEAGIERADVACGLMADDVKLGRVVELPLPWLRWERRLSLMHLGDDRLSPAVGYVRDLNGGMVELCSDMTAIT